MLLQWPNLHDRRHGPGGSAMARRNIVSFLYRLARTANDINALASGNPRRIARRARNKILGRALGRVYRW